MNEPAIKAQNLWSSFARKLEPLASGMELVANPTLDASEIGGLAGPKEEVATYACAATSPQIYEGWGTQPPTGILFLGQRGSGKRLLAENLATQTSTSFLVIDVPRLVLDVVHAGPKAAELVQGWAGILEELPPMTVFFDELEFSQAQEIGERRPDLPVGPIMDFLLELIDRTISADGHLVVASTSHPDSVRGAFLVPGRFERIVEVTPKLPDDVIEALQIHSRFAEKRAGRSLFDTILWNPIVVAAREASIGDWVRILHAVLRRKARCEASGEEPGLVTTPDMQEEVERFMQARRQIRSDVGNYV